jgi:hypothetical protein
MEDIYLVAEDKSLFSVATSANQRELLIKEGTLHFAVSDMSRSLNFITPFGTIAVLDILLRAATDSPQLKGYVSVKQNGSEIGIIGGGSMIVSTQQGEMMIESGKKLTLAQADMDVGAPEGMDPGAPEETESTDEKEDQGEKEGKESKAGMTERTKIILGAIGVAAVAVGVAALAGGGGGGGGGGDDGGSISPSSP